MNKIIISNLKTSCIIGINPNERSTPQEIMVDLVLSVDLSKSMESDDIKDTVDYDELAKRVIEFIENSNYHLLEKLAREAAELAKNLSKAEKVKVTVKKPAALKKADYAAVEINL